MNENENVVFFFDLLFLFEFNMEKLDKIVSVMIVFFFEVGFMERRREEVVEVKIGGDLFVIRIEIVDDGINLVDLYEVEEWNGLDMFGEYSFKQEVLMMGSNLLMLVGNIVLLDICIFKYLDN